jgi:FtsX-like permease family
MIRLGLRLAVGGGTEAITRLALIAVAVAIGVGLLLTTLAGLNAFNAQNERYAWLETGYSGAEPPANAASSDEPVAVDPLWWLLRADYFQGELIGRVDVAATGPDSPIPPGIAALPGPGEFYASPELSKLLAATPAAQLGDRYPGVQVGIIGAQALPAPDTSIIIIGRDVAELSAHDGARQVTRISTTSPSDCSGECAPVGTNANGMTMVLSVVAAALLFPVMVFIGGATRLSAARREQRFAAMRLVGATPRQIATIATVESSVAAVAGTIVGFGLFYALRPAIATIPFSGERFFTSDLSLSPANVLFVAVGIPAAAALAARIALRRVNVSPLGVTRRVTPPPPRAWRLIPLVAGIAWLGYLAYFSDIADSRSPTIQAYAYLAGVFLIMIGLLVAGPWLTSLGSRLTARHTKHPTGLIAARRLGDNPQTAFRAISGVVLAVFLASCAIGTITTIVAYNGGAAGDTANSTATLIHQVSDRPPAPAPTAAISDTATNELTSIPGVKGVATIHVDHSPHSASASGFNVHSFVSCAEIVHTPALGRCPDGADTVTVRPDFGGGVIDTATAMSVITWPAADVSTAELSKLPVDTIVVGTDGSAAAVEQARTVLTDLYPTGDPPQTLSEHQARNSQTINRYQQLANVVLFTSLPIAGCSLAVSIAGGLADRRRPFSLLRLTGVPLVMLRRVVTLEAAVPLLLGVAVSAAAGFAAAALFLRAQLDQTLQPPTLTYYLVIAAGVIASLAIIATTNPLLARITGPDTARNE